MISKSQLIEPPRWGIIKRWPHDPDEWIHPEDIETARELLPSIRVFRREVHSSEYLRLNYGRKSFRAKPTLWFEVGKPPFDVGDFVRVSGLFGIEYPVLGTVSEVIWNPRRGHFEFQLRTSAGGKLTKLYRERDLERVIKLDSRLTLRRPFGQSQNISQKLIGI